VFRGACFFVVTVSVSAFAAVALAGCQKNISALLPYTALSGMALTGLLCA